MKSGLKPAVKNRAAHGGEDCAARRVKTKAGALGMAGQTPICLVFREARIGLLAQRIAYMGMWQLYRDCPNEHCRKGNGQAQITDGDISPPKEEVQREQQKPPE